MRKEAHERESCVLVSRHWIIYDEDRCVAEVFGDGVIGNAPPPLPFSYHAAFSIGFYVLQVSIRS